MKSRFARTGLPCIFALGLIVSMAAPAHAEGPPCSLRRAAGNWGFTDSGTVVGVGLRIAVGILTLDSAGNVVNGAATSSLNGSITNETVSGTYTVNPDCTGTISVTIYSGGVELFVISGNTVLDSNMQHLRAIFTSVVESNGTALATVIGLDANKE